MRLMSNNLEKENSLLFAMGFSFEDEHIRNIVKRALKTNPTLMVFIFSYQDSGKKRYLELFGENDSNLLIITPSEFNETNALKEDDEIKEFDFRSINNVFKSISSKIPFHFKYDKYVEVEGDKISLTKTTPPEAPSRKSLEDKIKDLFKG